MVLNCLSQAWRPAAVASAVLLAVTLLFGYPATPTGAQGAPAEQTYIVRFQPNVVERPPKPIGGRLPGALVGPGGREYPRAAAARLASLHNGRLRHVYDYALQGFSITLSPQAAAALARNPSVLSVEPNGPVSIDGDPAAQSPATWGLDRIDQRSLPLSNSYDATSDGAGVTAYIIDTGILASHAQFTGRVGAGADFVDGDTTPTDCNGHGTHVAGTIGGATYGVAKAVTLVAVRVLDCGGSGWWDDVIAGIDWVTSQHDPGELAVANMSLGGGALTAVDNAIANSIADGVTYAVAAGNSNANACNYSPARTTAALTVAATTTSDARASYSNYGTCVDVFAPGSSITSAWYTSSTATNTISGTSMASPHVAGAAASYLASNPLATPADVATALKAAGTVGVVTSAGTGSPNLLLYVGAPPTFGTISGVVTAAAGGPLAGVTVSTNSGQTANTDSSGAYTLSNVPTGTRTVTASKATFVTYGPTTVTVEANTTLTLNFALAAVPACTALVDNDSDSSSRGGTVTINWTNGAGVQHVQVQRRLTGSFWSTRATLPSSTTTYSGSDSSSDPDWRLVPRCGGIDYPGAPFDPS